jgi:transcriptional regulator with XRE-family HTH domain
MTNNNHGENLGRMLRRQRVLAPLTLRELEAMSGVSSSHLGRIERGERSPSASVLQRIARPLGFEESELFSLAGYMSPRLSGLEEESADYSAKRLDPCVAKMLSQEPVQVQRAVIGILSILKSIAKVVE